jgi:hypothetical protein
MGRRAAGRYNQAMTTSLRAHFDGKVLIPEGQVDLPVNRPLEIQVSGIERPTAGSGTAAAILQAVNASPHLAAADVDELESSIARGSIAVSPKGEFDHAE